MEFNFTSVLQRVQNNISSCTGAGASQQLSGATAQKQQKPHSPEKLHNFGRRLWTFSTCPSSRGDSFCARTSLMEAAAEEGAEGWRDKLNPEGGGSIPSDESTEFFSIFSSLWGCISSWWASTPVSAGLIAVHRIYNKVTAKACNE